MDHEILVGLLMHFDGSHWANLVYSSRSPLNIHHPTIRFLFPTHERASPPPPVAPSSTGSGPSLPGSTCPATCAVPCAIARRRTCALPSSPSSTKALDPDDATVDRSSASPPPPSPCVSWTWRESTGGKEEGRGRRGRGWFSGGVGSVHGRRAPARGREDLGRDSGARLRVYAEMALLLQLLKNALRHQLDPQLKIAPLVILFNEGLALQHVVWYFLTASIQQLQLN
ncbi:uncharacterized protein [Triticum aestivum]|uniref:uncharacterized protein n=1 Tax=Triticum aestivum TaxID=4565 RepID=UPI001D004E35|nr:uncharacterized protein LOC123153052 [Triticum aestivum]